MVQCLFTAPGEQQEITIRITYDEGSCAPRFGPQRLNKFDARFPIFEKERHGILQRDRSGEQLLALAPDGIDDWVVDLAQVQSGAVAEQLAVERWLTEGEGDGETELPRIELGRGDDVSDIELRFGCDECRHGERTGVGVGHEVISAVQISRSA